MKYYESSVSPSSAICRGVADIAAVAAGWQYTCFAVSAVQSDMAVGGRVQHRRSERNRPAPLHQCSPVGETISVERSGGAGRPHPVGSAENLLAKSRDGSDRNRDVSPPGLAIGVHHLVFGETGKASASASGTGVAQSGDDSPYSLPSWSSLPHWADVVRNEGPAIRGKKNAIISLYRDPPKRGHVVCFDEMGPLQTIPRGGGAWGKRAATRPNRYKRNGTLQWFCAFCPVTGQAVGKGFRDKSGDSCQQFWEEHMLPFWPKGSIHLVMDNLSAHKKALRQLPTRIRRRLHVSWTPTNCSWLNLCDSYFATLKRTALHNTDYRSPEEIEQGLLSGVRYLNENPRPYRWKKI